MTIGRGLTKQVRRMSLSIVRSASFRSIPKKTHDFVATFPKDVVRQIIMLACGEDYVEMLPMPKLEEERRESIDSGYATGKADHSPKKEKHKHHKHHKHHKRNKHHQHRPMPHVLAAVSQSWRALVCTEFPSLWSTIQVTVSPEVHKEHLEAVIERSGNAGLHLVILDGGEKNPEVNKLLVEASDWWVELVMQVGAIDLAGVDGRLDMMRSLELTAPLNGDPCPIVNFTNAPALRSVLLDSVFPIGLPWPTIYSLTISGPGSTPISNEAYAIIQKGLFEASALDELIFASITLSSDAIDAPRLENNNVSEVLVWDSDFLPAMKMPGVIEFSTGDVEMVPLFIVQSQCAIQRLVLRFDGLGHGDFWLSLPDPVNQALAATLSSLVLELGGGNAVYDLFEGLSQTTVFPGMDELAVFVGGEGWRPRIRVLKEMLEVVESRSKKVVKGGVEIKKLTKVALHIKCGNTGPLSETLPPSAMDVVDSLKGARGCEVKITVGGVDILA